MRQPALIGFLVGCVASILPSQIPVLTLPFLVMRFFVLMLRHPPMDLRRHFVGSMAALATVAFAIWLPLGRIDRKVGPMHYQTMPLVRLAETLRADWGISVFTFSKAVASFDVNEPMTRRMVIEKLARETGSGLRFEYCDYGSTFLFGGSTAGFLWEKPPPPER